MVRFYLASQGSGSKSKIFHFLCKKENVMLSITENEKQLHGRQFAYCKRTFIALAVC